MRIGFDITALRIAVGGIFWYDLNLVSAAVAAGPQHEFLLLDYLPIRGRQAAPPDVAKLESENKRLREIVKRMKEPATDTMEMLMIGGTFAEVLENMETMLGIAAEAAQEKQNDKL